MKEERSYPETEGLHTSVSEDSAGVPKSTLRSKWSKKKVALGGMATAGILAISAFAIVPTTAAWQDSETVGTSMASGTFDLEISTNGGTTWQSTGGSTVSFTMPGFTRWAPGDQSNTGSNVKLRVSPSSTNDGVIQFDTCGTGTNAGVRVTGSGASAAHYSWTMGSTNTAGSTFTISSTGLNSCSPSPLTSTTGKVTLKKGDAAGVAVPISVRALDTLPQGGSASTLTIRFTAESVSE